ncbi:MAG: hypothetical protein IJV83_02880 [Clostridia bacterium]|nr:hypothetical protein [Clostridia bacterium]
MQKTENKSEKLSSFRKDFPYLCVMSVLVSFGGWIGENISRYFGSRTMDSRFHLLPFLSPYGLLVLLLYAALRDPDRIAFFGRPVFKKINRKTKLLSNLLCLLVITAAGFFGELLVGTFWEKAFGVVLWDYTNHSYCFTRYTCLMTTILYGVGGYLFFRLLFFPLFRQIKKLPRKTAKILGYSLGVLILIDTAIMGIHIAVFGKAPIYWSVRLR